MIHKVIEKRYKGIKRRYKKVNREIIEKLATLITAAFGFVAALGWNSAIQSLFKEIFGTAESILAMFIYAVFVTIVAVILTLWIGKIKARL